MNKTKEMFQATHKRNSNDWNAEDIHYQQLESSVEHWMLSDPDDAVENLGEDLTSAVKEALDYD